MTPSILFALLVYSFVSSVTPGPNNIMLFTSGVNFGLRRTIPHMFGISIGFGVLLLAVGAGMGAVLANYPEVYLALKALGGAYMLYLAWRIANSGPPGSAKGAARPMTFLEAAMFQWVNPKAWVMAVVAMATYTSEGDYATNVAIIVFVFAVVNFPTISIWAVFGMAMRRWLSQPRVLRVFNLVMAFALVLSLWPMLRG